MDPQHWPAANPQMQDPAALTPHPRNSRVHSEQQVAQVAASMQEWGFTMPVLVTGEGVIVAGHCRVQAALSLGYTQVPTVLADGWSDEQVRAYVIADNRLTELGTWNPDVLREEALFLNEAEFTMPLLGFDDADLGALLADDPLPPLRARGMFVEPEPPANPGGLTDTPPVPGNMAQIFGVPPFSVLDARQGRWADRKREWFALGIASELGRGEKLLSQATPRKGYGSGYDLSKGEHVWGGSGTSIFDPVLCELAYRWFCPPGGKIVDPFAGGSVRGIVASRLGMHYYGGELRGEQVKANRMQFDAIGGREGGTAKWYEGDSTHLYKKLRRVKANFMFSCPPYADLEIYSDDPADISNMPYEQFREAYAAIIANTAKVLEPDSFAAFVVGEVRAKNGLYRGLVPDTIHAFEDAGLHYYDEIVYVTPVGSLPVRAGKAFKASRKIGKSHQNLLVFVKGDYRKAVAKLGDISGFLEIDEEAEDAGQS